MTRLLEQAVAAGSSNRHVDSVVEGRAAGAHRATPPSGAGRAASEPTLNGALTTNYALGVSALVDADMNVASTRLQALQTQQQLGIQSLSIANQNSQLILKLFQ